MKTYRILTLGASGSGKTVFLASMFKKLSIQGEEGFFLDTENHKQQILLNEVYTNLIAGGVWPAGTKYSQITKWAFTCRVRNAIDSLDFPACTFEYYDYAGGRLTDMAEDDLELQDIINGSDAILGLLDGEKILALLNNDTDDPKVDIFINLDLPSIIEWMTNRKVPIQFVISKWDLLEGKYSLKEIMIRLFEIPVFEELVRSKNNSGHPVRLIPVSSVGTGFVKPESSGAMVKIAGAIPHPLHVEVPVSCIVPDRLKQSIIENRKNEQQYSSIDTNNPGLLHNVLKGILVTGPVIDFAVSTVVSLCIEEGDKLGALIANRFDDLLLSGVRRVVINNEKKLDQLRISKEQSLNDVRDETTALKTACEGFLYIEEKFAKDFPSSELDVRYVYALPSGMGA